MSSAEKERAGYRLSPQQRQLWRWMAEEREPYRALAAVRLSGELQVKWLEAALKEVMRRHEILRTKVEVRRLLKQSVQVIEAEGECEFSYVEQGAGRDIYEELKEAAQGSGSGLRVALARVSEREHELVLRAGGMSADEAGMRVLVEEVARSYEAHRSGAAVEHEPMQYADVAEWQNQMLEGEAAKAARQFWREQDFSSLHCLKLPFEDQTPGIDRFKPRQLSRAIDPALVASLEAVARDHGVSISVLLLSCWHVLLSRLTGQTSIVAGALFDGRVYSELQNTPGLFARYLPIRAQMDDRILFGELLEQNNKTIDEIYNWQEYFDWHLINSSSNDHEQTFFFPAAFDFSEGASTYSAGELIFYLHRLYACIDRFRLKLRCVWGETSVVTEFHYDSSLFSEEAIKQTASHFHQLLLSVAASPQQRVIDLQILTNDERNHLLFGLSQTSIERTTAAVTIQELFEAQVERTPQSVAVVFEKEQLTYMQLNARANQLAHHLRSMGVAADALVGICMERSLELVVGLLGVLKAGGSYIPLDPALPKERLAFMLKEANVQVVLTQPELIPRFPAEVKCETPASQKIHQNVENPRATNDPANLCYVIYTSGSTGVPKGVMIEHRQLLGYTQAITNRLDLPASANFAFVSTFAADLGNTMIFPALSTGGCLHVISEDRATDPDALADYFSRHSIDCLKIVPSHLKALLTARNPAQVLPHKRLILGGEASHFDLIKQVRSLKPDCLIFNHYGPTETTVGVSTHRLDSESVATETVPIGRPLANTETYILDQQMQPVPIGVTGELYLGGVGLARGYQQQPGLTAERFVPHPYARAAGARLYRTGDVARYRRDGAIEFLGRVDHQVKLRGYRIELGEIESVLRQHEEVQEAVVVVRGTGAEQRLVGYVTAAERNGAGRELSRQLREYLQGRVPEYMVPAALLVLERMPLSANGKLDRGALPEPDAGAGGGEKEGPRNATEALIASVWQQVLGLESVSVHDNFFELGGDSILGIQVVARLRQAGLVLTPRQLFQHQSIAALAQVAGELSRVAPASKESGATEESGAAVVLTPIQQRFFAESGAEKHHWNQAVLLASKERLEPERLRQVVAALVARHDALRLRYEQEAGGEWRQYVAGVESERVPLTSIDLSALEETGRAALEAAAAAAQGSLDLSAGPLLRVVHFRLGGDAGERLLLVIHHLAVDGVSWRILLEELEQGYQQSGGGGEIDLGPRELSFREWAQQLAAAGQSEQAEREAEYWSEQCRRARQALGSERGSEHDAGLVGGAASVTQRLSRAETQVLLRGVVKRYGSQITEVLLAALWRAVSRVRGERVVVVELEGHGREELGFGVGAWRTVGWLTTLYPVVLEARAGAGMGEVLATLKQEGLAEHGLWYGVVRYLGGGAGGAAMAVRPWLSFNYLGQLDQVLVKSELFRGAGERLGEMRSRQARRWHEVEVNAAVVGGRLEVEWSYGSGVSAEAVAEMAQEYMAGLREVINKDRSSSQAAGAGAEEQERYGLTAMQEGMLFHSLLAPESSVYIVQKTYALRGQLNIEALQRAWEEVIERHAVLRTSFSWKAENDPQQIVQRRVRLPWRQEDWRALSAAQQQTALEEFLTADRAQSFDLATAPLLRLSLFILSDDTCQLVFTSHQLLLDGWSAVIVLQEVSALYQANCRSEKLHLPARRPFRDYISWLREQDLEAAEQFWRRELQGIRAATPLGGQTTYNHPTRPDKQYGKVQVQMSRQATDALQRFARSQQVTLNTVVQGAWALLLSRYSGEDTVVFGAVVSGRPAGLAGVEEMVGLFINTLPVRVEVTEERAVGEWLRELQERQAEAREYETVSLVQVQGWSEMERGQPLFESIIVFENYPETKSTPGKNVMLGIESVRFFELTNYPLTIVVGPAEELSLIFVYDENRFDAAAIRRMLDQLETLLEKMGDGAAQKLTELPLLTETEKHLLLSEWNAIGPEAAYPPLHEIFADHVSRNADALAISFRGEELTYGDLNEQSNQLAHALRSLGSEVEGKVVVMLDSGPRQIAALLGVLKAGCAFICLDPNYPPSRLRQILEEVNPDFVVTDSTCLEWHRMMLEQCRHDFGSTILTIDQINLNSYPKSNPDITVGPEAIAFIAFTSGSTGRPKGIVQSHRSFAQFLEWQSRYLNFGENKRIAQWALITFDASYCEIFGALCSGATLCLETVAVRHDPPALVKWLRDERISVLIVVPSFGRQVLQAIEAAEQELPDLEALGLAGEVLPVDLAIAWRQRFPNRPRLVNLYGPTECALATYYEVENIAEHSRSIPVGRAIDGRQILILDRERRLCPIGVKGEIYIRSPYLAQGYFQNEMETRKAFIQNPLHEDYPDRVYRTGDFGRWLPDGNLEFFGRVDNQVKVRGTRVELEEIESTLRRHESVNECVVAVRSFTDDDQRVVAYVVSDENISATELRSFLMNWLPQSVLPANFVFLDEIPRTPNGKIDRKALAATSDQWQPEAEVDFVAPKTELESIVAEIWRDVLRVERVGVNDNFFALGGHSLLATQVVNRLRETCSVNLPLRSVFETPSVAGMAVSIEKLRNEAQSQAGRVANIINEINFLSDDEVEALLMQKKIVPNSTITPEISAD